MSIMISKQIIWALSFSLILSASALVIVSSDSIDTTYLQNAMGLPSKGDNKDDPHSGMPDKVGDGDSGHGNDDKPIKNKEGRATDDDPSDPIPVQFTTLSLYVDSVDAQYDHVIYIGIQSEDGSPFEVQIGEDYYFIEDGKAQIQIFDSSHDSVNTSADIAIMSSANISSSPYIFVKNTSVYIHANEEFCKTSSEESRVAFSFEDLKDSTEYENDWDYNDVILVLTDITMIS